MEILRDKTINAGTVKPQDKIIKNITGNTMSIQIDGDAKLSMKGSHANFESNNSYAIALINMTTLDKVTETTAFSWDADYGDLVSIVGDDVVDGIFTPQLLKVYEMVFTWNGFVMNCVVKGSRYTAPQE